MNPEPAELALENLVRLKADIREDLDGIEERIAELEAEGVVKRSRIETLASVLKELVDNEEDWLGQPDVHAAASHRRRAIEESRNRLKGVLHEVEKEAKNGGRRDQVAETYGSYRSRLTELLNAVDLAVVGLSKKSDIREAKPESEQQQRPATPSAVSRSPLGASAIIRSQELERQRIAREIHDGPAQAIANVVLRMDILSKLYEKDPDRVRDELLKMKTIAQGALDEIRGFIFDLRPMTLQDLGLVATIKRVVASLKELAGVNVRFIVEGPERSLGQLVTLAVFRIAQEATTNLKKYSDCKSAWIHLKYLEDRVILIVEDNGVGFDLDEVAKSQKKYASFGLLGIQERADDINAELEIITSPGEGTKVVLVVPTLNNPAISATLD